MDRLDAVAVRVEEESAVVIGGVVLAQSRLSVAAVTGLHAATPERVDVLAGGSGERDVEVTRERSRVLCGCNREVVPLEELLPLRLSIEHGRIEAARCLEIGDADGHVVEHQRISIASPKE